MEIKFIEEFKLTENEQLQISYLLANCFPKADYNGRYYYNQLPNYRLLIIDNHKIIGHMGIDYRNMKLGKQIIKVLGLIDLAIDPHYQQKGLGTKLITHFVDLSSNYKWNVDFLLVISNHQSFFQKFGFHPMSQQIKWLTIEDNINHGISQLLYNQLLIKKVNKIDWKENEVLDMFGYWY